MVIGGQKLEPFDDLPPVDDLPFNPPRHVTTKVEEMIIARNLFDSATSLLNGTQIHKVYKDSSGKTWRSVTIEYEGDAINEV